jgi:hypothetical protein
MHTCHAKRQSHVTTAAGNRLVVSPIQGSKRGAKDIDTNSVAAATTAFMWENGNKKTMVPCQRQRHLDWKAKLAVMASLITWKEGHEKISFLSENERDGTWNPVLFIIPVPILGSFD